MGHGAFRRLATPPRQAGKQLLRHCGFMIKALVFYREPTGRTSQVSNTSDCQLPKRQNSCAVGRGGKMISPEGRHLFSRLVKTRLACRDAPRTGTKPTKFFNEREGKKTKWAHCLEHGATTNMKTRRRCWAGEKRIPKSRGGRRGQATAKRQWPEPRRNRVGSTDSRSCMVAARWRHLNSGDLSRKHA